MKMIAISGVAPRVPQRGGSFEGMAIRADRGARRSAC
jgi:hypothetical protein